MKAKLNLGGLKTLALLHGEKVLLALIGLFAVMFLYSSIGVERLPQDKQAAVLTERVSASQNKISESTWEDAPKDQIKPHVPFAGPAIRDVPFDPYDSKLSLDQEVVPPTVLRTDPVLLSVEDFEVHSGAGLIALVDEGTRRRRAQEELRREEEREKEMAKEREAGEEGGRGRGGRGEGGFGGGRGFEGGMAGEVDPDNPNRRAVTGTVRPEGVPLQGDELVKVAYWNVILGKVPVQTQNKLFDDALKNARGYNEERDRAHYLGYLVERAEVTADGKQLPWAPVRIRNAEGGGMLNGITTDTLPKAAADWPQEMEEIIDKRYQHMVLTYPLPPRVGKNWGADSKLAEVPLETEVDLEKEQMDAMEKNAPKEEGSEDELFSASPGGPGQGFAGEGGRGFGGPGMGMGGRGFRGDGGRGFGGGRGRGGGGRGFGGEMGGRGFGGGRGMGGGGGASGGNVRRNLGEGMEEPFPQKPFWMFRFVDFDVQPGKSYKYRVRLIVQDVNDPTYNMIPKSILDKTVLARVAKKKPSKTVAFVLSDWSQATPTVAVPNPGELRVTEARPASDKQFNSEPTVNLLVESFDVDAEGKAMQAGIEEAFRRGSTMNMVRDAEILVDQGRYIDKSPGFKFQTDSTLLDIRGGERLVGSLTKPGKVLVMDAGGNLSVRSELRDLNDVLEHREVFAKPEKGEGQGDFGGRGGFGGGGRGGR